VAPANIFIAMSCQPIFSVVKWNKELVGYLADWTSWMSRQMDG